MFPYIEKNYSIRKFKKGKVIRASNMRKESDKVEKFNKFKPTKFLKYIFLLSSSVLCTLIIYLAISLSHFPEEIKILQQEENKLIFNIPLMAKIESESINVLNINSKPIEENITLNLNEAFTIESQECGTAQMTLNAFGIPIKKVTLDIVPHMEVIPCGATVGVRINTDGVMVLGTGYVSGEDGISHNPSEGKLKSGDLIISANHEDLTSKEQLIKIIETSEKDVSLSVKRDGQMNEIFITPIKSTGDKLNKIGVWVRDSTQGIGTMTYYNPETNKFAALGHGIIDIDTKQLMSIKSGVIMKSQISSVKKGRKGVPGELIGDINNGKVIGEITNNTTHGIYGSINRSSVLELPKERMKIGLQSEVHEGPAVIRSNVERSEINEYDIYIESVNRYSTDNSKGMVVRITDPRLLSKSNGIVQGMSGSPIIQDNKLMGAITHVFVQDPTKGYGIFIENMLKNE